MNFLKTGIRGVQVAELYSGSAIMKLRLFCNPAVRLLENNIFLLLDYILDVICIHLCLYTYLLIFCKYCNRQKFRIQQRHSNINNYVYLFLVTKTITIYFEGQEGTKYLSQPLGVYFVGRMLRSNHDTVFAARHADIELFHYIPQLSYEYVPISLIYSSPHPSLSYALVTN